jgi:formate/nitrite transporter FocA (FNT family)
MDEATVERSVERAQEDERFTSVIVQRNAEARRHPDDILQLAIHEGHQQCQRSSWGLGLSAVAAGLTVGSSAMAVGVVTALHASGELDVPLRIAQALVYPTGFVVCVISATELFTEHTATALYPALDRRSSLCDVVRVWAVVLIGNLLGTLLSAGMLALAEPVIGAASGYAEIAHHLSSFSALALFSSAVLAGWLMAMGAWLILATPPGFAQIAAIYTVTFLIGLGGLHHSIAGTAEALVAWMVTDALSLPQVFRFTAIAAPGNLVGGSIFVAVLNYGHIRSVEHAQGLP